MAVETTTLKMTVRTLRIEDDYRPNNAIFITTTPIEGQVDITIMMDGKSIEAGISEEEQVALRDYLTSVIEDREQEAEENGENEDRY